LFAAVKQASLKADSTYPSWIWEG